MNLSRKNLAREAIEKSLEVREQHDFDFRSPICIYGLCEKVGIKVAFVDDVSMEGVYAALDRPTILLSALRPLSRRAFTCAHELGHHAFNHGSTIDELREEAEESAFEPNEFLADSFAGAVLMPALGLKRAFAQRKFEPKSASPEQMFVVACAFGVGYTTLIGQLAYGYQTIPVAHAQEIAKFTLPNIRERFLGFPTKEHLIVADRHHPSGTLDAEVGMLILLPTGSQTESDQIEFVADLKSGRLFRAQKPGLARAVVNGSDWGLIVRVARARYAGLAKYRHLQEIDDE